MVFIPGVFKRLAVPICGVEYEAINKSMGVVEMGAFGPLTDRFPRQAAPSIGRLVSRYPKGGSGGSAFRIEARPGTEGLPDAPGGLPAATEGLPAPAEGLPAATVGFPL